MSSTCQQLAARLGELFVCSAQGSRIRIRTPLYYPDGSVIDLFYEEGAGSRTLSDLGETLGWLRLQTGVLKRTPKQNRIIEDACLTHGIELFKGMLTLRLRVDESLAGAVLRLGQAAVRVSDLWFTSRLRSVLSVGDEVADFLTERKIQFERNVTVPGRSGRVWSIDFHTRVSEVTCYVSLLATGNKGVTRGLADHALAGWVDMAHLRVTTFGLRFITLFDDTVDVWAEENLRLVQSHSEVARWSRPDEFAQILTAA